MFCAVVAGSDTNTICWTKPIAKAPATTLIRYRAPAILANWRGDAPPTESMKALPRLVSVTCAITARPNAARPVWTVRTVAGRLSHGKGGFNNPQGGMPPEAHFHVSQARRTPSWVSDRAGSSEAALLSR